MQISREKVARIKPSVGDLLPRLPGQNPRVDFLFPKHRQRLPLGIVVDTRHLHECRIVALICRHDVFDKVLSLPDMDDLTSLRHV